MWVVCSSISVLDCFWDTTILQRTCLPMTLRSPSASTRHWYKCFMVTISLFLLCLDRFWDRARHRSIFSTEAVLGAPVGCLHWIFIKCYYIALIASWLVSWHNTSALRRDGTDARQTDWVAYIALCIAVPYSLSWYWYFLLLYVKIYTRKKQRGT